MAFSLNRIMLIGNLGRDAETRFTTTNVSVTSFSMATTHSFKNKEGNWQNETTWHNIVSFSLSDYFKENLKKGKKLYVEGRLSKRDYTDKENIKRFAVEVIAEKIILLDGGLSDSSGDQTDFAPADNVKDVQDNDDLPF
ncbi:MAG: single-stranded DNA-binding protein [Ignavibacteriales bacterium]|nr:MAG: single-stranded DNA-binding protein [Ignavibacteriales bacterium]